MAKPKLVTIDGRTYEVHFQHSTTCMLVPQPNSLGVIDGDPLTGRTNCSRLDRFDKQVGNKIAFTRAIADLPKEQRRQAWGTLLQKAGKIVDTSVHRKCLKCPHRVCDHGPGGCMRCRCKSEVDI